MATDTEGLYRAKTTLINPSDRKVRLIAPSNTPIILRLNDEIVINCQSIPAFMPAYHRAPKEQWIELTLGAGEYEVEVEVRKEGVPLETYILPVSTRDTETPGPFYYYTDMLFGTNR